MPIRRLAVAALVLLLAACGEETRLPKPSLDESPDAEAVADALERDTRSFLSLAPAQRAEAELAFGPRLERDLAACRGTRYENVPLYKLANWTLVHGGGDGPDRALAMLRRLQVLPSPAYRNFGRVLMVQALLASGRGGEARSEADALARVVPELGAMAQQHVRFYDLVGSPAPAALPGAHAGGQAEPAAASFVVVVFVGAADAYARPAVEPWPALAKDLRGRLEVVAVATAGDLLAAAGAAGQWGCAVRWTRPEDPAWLESWRVPGLPSAVLLGPGPARTILAVNPTRERVRQALGESR